MGCIAKGELSMSGDEHLMPKKSYRSKLNPCEHQVSRA